MAAGLLRGEAVGAAFGPPASPFDQVRGALAMLALWERRVATLELSRQPLVRTTPGVVPATPQSHERIAMRIPVGS